MEAIVLAGGLGTRLREIVKDVPKPMADIGGRPFLSYVLEYLAREGVRKAWLSVGYLHEVIRKHFGTHSAGLDIDYVIEHELLGTGGAIRESLARTTSQHVVIANGDTFFAVKLKAMMDVHLRTGADITMALKPMQKFNRYGSVLVNAEGRITGFREKAFQDAGLINGGVYIVKKAGLAGLDACGRKFSFESDYLQKKVGELAAYAFVWDDYFIDIGIGLDYKKALLELPRIVQERML